MSNLALSFLLLAGAASAQSLAQADRDRALSHLQATRKQTLDSVQGLTAAQMNFKPGPDRWSVAEVVEHIAVTERGLFDSVKQLAAGPPAATPLTKRMPDEMLLKGISSRDQKAKAPEQFVPSGKLGKGDALLAEYRKTRDATLAFARTTQIDLRSRYSDSPVGKLDAFQWILFISAHNERHNAQIAEVKADAKFPK